MHKFALGQKVYFTGEVGSHHLAGDYEIVRLLPENTAGEIQYRLKKIPDGQERVVREHQLLRSASSRALR